MILDTGDTRQSGAGDWPLKARRGAWCPPVATVGVLCGVKERYMQIMDHGIGSIGIEAIASLSFNSLEPELQAASKGNFGGTSLELLEIALSNRHLPI
jgi:hypothetical protein